MFDEITNCCRVATSIESKFDYAVYLPVYYSTSSNKIIIKFATFDWNNWPAEDIGCKYINITCSINLQRYSF